MNLDTIKQQLQNNNGSTGSIKSLKQITSKCLTVRSKSPTSPKNRAGSPVRSIKLLNTSTSTASQPRYLVSDEQKSLQNQLFASQNISMSKRNQQLSMSRNSGSLSLSMQTSSTLFRQKLQGKHAMVPKVNIQKIFSEKKNLYHDQDVVCNFDDLIDKGYNLVVQKKHDRDFVKEEALHLQNEIANVQKEINNYNQLIVTVSNQIENQLKINKNYQYENSQLNQNIIQVQQVFDQKEKEVDKLSQALTQLIRNEEINNNNLKSQIHSNRAQHLIEKEKLKNQIEGLQKHYSSQVKKLQQLQGNYNQIQIEQAERKRKMLNKSNMFMGILKH